MALMLCGVALAAAADVGDTAAAADGEAAGGASGDGAVAEPAGAGKQRQPFVVFVHQDSWVLEGCAVAFLLTFLVRARGWAPRLGGMSQHCLRPAPWPALLPMGLSLHRPACRPTSTLGA